MGAWETRKQPDWFKEQGTLLKELIDRRNLLIQRSLRSGKNSDRQRYVLQRREVTKAVKKVGYRRRQMKRKWR